MWLTRLGAVAWYAWAVVALLFVALRFASPHALDALPMWLTVAVTLTWLWVGLRVLQRAWPDWWLGGDGNAGHEKDLQSTDWDGPVDLGLRRALRDLETEPVSEEIRIWFAGDGRQLEIWLGGRFLTQRDFRWVVLQLWDVINDLGQEEGFDPVAVIATGDPDSEEVLT